MRRNCHIAQIVGRRLTGRRPNNRKKMSEQIRITVDLDEAIYALKGLSKAEEEIAIKFQNCGLQDEAMEHFRNERALKTAIKTIKEQMSVICFSA